MEEEYDVCVIGAGPAGATAATFIAMAGHRVLLVEKESLPIYKIGESLLPATIHGICAMLGVNKELEEQNFVRKLGGTFRWGKNKAPWTFAFAESSRFPGPTSYAYQVERIKFDTILVNNAKRKGVTVLERHRAVDLVFEGERISGLKVATDCDERTVRCKFVVDASGHTSSISRYAGERIVSQFFRNIAVFGYYSNGKRLPPPNSGNIFSVAFDKGWFWYIPLTDQLTSVGAVIGQEYSALLQHGHEGALSNLIASCEPIKDLLANAQRCDESPYDLIRVRKDYSYSHSSFWRSGLVLIGDAACFIDPVFSSGVHLATYSGLLAARSINTCLEHQLSEQLAFTEFESRYRREYNHFYEFLTAFYDLDQHLESYYWRARVLMNAKEAGNHAFLNLVGGDASGELSHNVGAAQLKSQRISEHLFPAASGDAEDMYMESSIQSPERRQFWSNLNAEGFQLQLASSLGRGQANQRPLFVDGLIPSRDSLHWVRPSARR